MGGQQTALKRADHRKAWMVLMGIIDEDGTPLVSPQLGEKLSARGRKGAGRSEGGLFLAARTMPKLDENLRRADLDPRYRMHATARRKLLYEIIHPETANGATGKHRNKSQLRNNCEADDEPADRFTATTAKVTELPS